MPSDIAKILVIDDDFHCRDIIATALAQNHHEIDKVENGKEGLEALKNKKYDLVLCDLMMPKVDGMSVLSEFKKDSSEANFVLITAFGTIERAVEAMKEGAYDFLVKPINLKQLNKTVSKALETTFLRRQNRKMRDQLQQKGLPQIIGNSANLKSVLELVNKVAERDSTVLITGPSGTGKELIARQLHYKSKRLMEDFVVINCAAIPGNLLESQFFGHKRGSFTGADHEHEGLFQKANGGTLFLDEVGELDLNLQVKLLRAIQDGEIRKVGGNDVEFVDVRVIAATNRLLAEEVKRGAFREDLYYRLNVVSIDMPPLKSRREDLPLLLDHFLDKYNPILHKRIKGYDEGFLRILNQYDFPGNIRELENIVQKAMILCEGDILNEDLVKQNTPSVEDIGKFLNADGLHEMVNKLEKEVITQALHMFKSNHSKAAKFLKIPRSTLYKKLHDYQIDLKKS